MPLYRRALPALACALASFALTAQTPAPDAPRPPLAGTYSLTRPGADSLQQLELHLRPDGRATLTTAYPGYTKTAAGTPVLPRRESGTWEDAHGLAVVHLTQSGELSSGHTQAARAENITLFFKLTGCALAVAHDPAGSFTFGGAAFKKHPCP